MKRTSRTSSMRGNVCWQTPTLSRLPVYYVCQCQSMSMSYHIISRALCQPSHQLKAKTHSTTRLFDAFWQPSHPMQTCLFNGARRALLKPRRVSWLEVNQPGCCASVSGCFNGPFGQSNLVISPAERLKQMHFNVFVVIFSLN